MASFEMSVAIILASGSSLAMVMARQPEPVPTSTIVGCSDSLRAAGLTPGRKGLPARFSTASMICSDSGRGMSTLVST